MKWTESSLRCVRVCARARSHADWTRTMAGRRGDRASEGGKSAAWWSGVAYAGAERLFRIMFTSTKCHDDHAGPF